MHLKQGRRGWPRQQLRHLASLNNSVGMSKEGFTPYATCTEIQNTGPELQCLLKIKEDLSKVLIFQHAILDA